MICLNVTENELPRSFSLEEGSFKSSTPAEKHLDESVNASIPPLVIVPSEPSHAGPSHPPKPAGVNILLDQMAQILATAFR